ncbi:MAG: DUF3160 domain-containing protein [Candidatus Riflebacteria bacterium]|nr:DUF3160 domain-containing protein [Candidatus Riflebacteria bacterium]
MSKSLLTMIFQKNLSKYFFSTRSLQILFLFFLLLSSIPCIGGPVFESVEKISCPVFSPDSNSIAFLSGKEALTKIQILEINSKKLSTLLENPGGITSLCFSNDGTDIFYTGKSDQSFDIFKIELTTGKIKKITNSPLQDEFQVWIPRLSFNDPKFFPQKKFERIFFLCGKNGVGELRSITTTGKRDICLVSGDFEHFSLGDGFSSSLLSTSKKIFLADLFSQNEDNQTILKKPSEIRPLDFSFDSSFKPVFAPNSEEILLKRENKISFFDPETLENSNSTFSDTLQAQSDFNDGKIAIIKKSGEKFVLSVEKTCGKKNSTFNFFKLAKNSDFDAEELKKIASEIEHIGFSIPRENNSSFSDLYLNNYFSQTDSYISLDSAFFLFFLHFFYCREYIEKNLLCPIFFQIVKTLEKESFDKWQKFSEDDLNNPFLKTWAFFSLAALLENSDFSVVEKKALILQEEIRSMVFHDLKIIYSHEIGESEILSKKINFSQSQIKSCIINDKSNEALNRLFTLFSQTRIENSNNVQECRFFLSLLYLLKTTKYLGSPICEILNNLSLLLDFFHGGKKGQELCESFDAFFPKKASQFSELLTPEKETLFLKKFLLDSTNLSEVSKANLFFLAPRNFIDQDILFELSQEFKRLKINQNPTFRDVLELFGITEKTNSSSNSLSSTKNPEVEKLFESLTVKESLLPENFWQRPYFNEILFLFNNHFFTNSLNSLTSVDNQKWKNLFKTRILALFSLARKDFSNSSTTGKIMETEEHSDTEIMEKVDLFHSPEIYVDPYPEFYNQLEILSEEIQIKTDQLLKILEKQNGSIATEDKNLLEKTNNLLSKTLSHLGKIATKELSNERLDESDIDELLKFGQTISEIGISLSSMGREKSNFFEENIPFSSEIQIDEASQIPLGLSGMRSIWLIRGSRNGYRLFRGGILEPIEK